MRLLGEAISHPPLFLTLSVSTLAFLLHPCTCGQALRCTPAHLPTHQLPTCPTCPLANSLSSSPLWASINLLPSPPPPVPSAQLTSFQVTLCVSLDALLPSIPYAFLASALLALEHLLPSCSSCSSSFSFLFPSLSVSLIISFNIVSIFFFHFVSLDLISLCGKLASQHSI